MECDHRRRERATLQVTLVERGATHDGGVCETCAALPEARPLLSGDPPPDPDRPADRS
jgi:protein-arginine kinase activator protein McsA